MKTFMVDFQTLKFNIRDFDINPGHISGEQIMKLIDMVILKKLNYSGYFTLSHITK